MDDAENVSGQDGGCPIERCNRRNRNAAAPSLIGRTDFGMEIIDLCFSSIAGHFTDQFYLVKAWKKKHPRVDARVLLLPTLSPNGGDF